MLIWIALARLLTWGVATPLSHQAIEKEKIPVAYSEFWALFHFFLHAEKGKWRNPLISYIKDLRKNPPSLENREEHLTRFQRLLSSDLAAFERHWIKTVLKWR